MSDNIGIVWNKFFKHRTRNIWERFPGQYRAFVVETNDPLNMHRVRYKCPELHDWDLKDEDCPWAVPSFDLGTKRHGRWSHPCRGDWVWIAFEKSHPYGSIWTGFADPTRRKFYSYPSIFNISPLSVTEDGDPDSTPTDYDEDYLPKDGRPMSHGWQDRYGNLDIHSSVGFFPTEHKDKPPLADHDALQGSEFKAGSEAPEVNKPDKKYMTRVTKYGNMMIMGDQGYYWQKDSSKGEFKGSFDDDEKFETDRWLYLQKLINEDVPDSDDEFGDQRRVEIKTRYGHKLEFRDVGWAQEEPIASKTREGEYGDPATIGSGKHDFRWIKIRTKAGMLIQACDKGAHPNDDEFVKRKLVDEVGHKTEREDQHWEGKDARWIRMVTRHGLKFVLDDRGTDDKKAREKELPRANGILIKGRRSPGAKKSPEEGSPKGFYWEFNENDEANHASWGSPLGLSMEINDRYQYIMLSASMGKEWAKDWKHIEENEFIRKPTMLEDPEHNAHHLKLDHDNEYIRLKTRATGKNKPESPAEMSDNEDEHQGIEMRDGQSGDGVWTEIVDSEHRGMWWTKKHHLGIWRAAKNRKMYTWKQDEKREIVVYNDENNGPIKIYARGRIEIKSLDDIHLDAEKDIKIKAGGDITMECNNNWSALVGAKYMIDALSDVSIKTGGAINNQCTNIFGILGASSVEIPSIINAKEVNAYFPPCMPGPGAGTEKGSPNPADIAEPAGDLITPIVPPIEPTDRAKTYNEPFEECPIEEVEHKIE